VLHQCSQTKKAIAFILFETTHLKQIKKAIAFILFETTHLKKQKQKTKEELIEEFLERSGYGCSRTLPHSNVVLLRQS